MISSSKIQVFESSKIQSTVNKLLTVTQHYSLIHILHVLKVSFLFISCVNVSHLIMTIYCYQLLSLCYNIMLSFIETIIPFRVQL